MSDKEIDVFEFIKKGKEAGQDSFGICNTNELSIFSEKEKILSAKPFNAEDAKKIADNFNGVTIRKAFELILDKIYSISKEGGYSLVNPFSKIVFNLTTSEEDLVVQELKKRRFNIVTPENNNKELTILWDFIE